ncbi:hypothetical protein QTA56_13400 [Acinetobacter sp. VNH17]|uniref:Uncharacterized protein n=1 Tax=Acinetobacter thutiue TaxID=2998078 RepID=A0ABT7WRA4_9GAMM|nr:hypothetical protein [Acinetobacter thutiue]MCY6413112.1 hypothetical protein [Acinetobacter thutiue]MDN0015221.1 hypothetical protein [Acinetobacter thutiue]
MGYEYSLTSEDLDVDALYLEIKQIIENVSTLKVVFSKENHMGFKVLYTVHLWRADIEIEKLAQMVYLILHNGNLQNILSTLQIDLAAKNLKIMIEEL